MHRHFQWDEKDTLIAQIVFNKVAILNMQTFERLKTQCKHKCIVVVVVTSIPYVHPMMHQHVLTLQQCCHCLNLTFNIMKNI